MGRHSEDEKVTFREVYNLVDQKVGDVEDKVDKLLSKVANIEGRLMMVPILISSGIGVFFFIIQLAIRNIK